MYPGNQVAEINGLGEGRQFFLAPNNEDPNSGLGAFPLDVPAGEIAQTVFSGEEQYWHRFTYGLGTIIAPGVAGYSNTYPLFVEIFSGQDWSWVERWTPWQAVFGRPADREYPIPNGIIVPPGEDLVIRILNDGPDDVRAYAAFASQRLEAADENA